MKQILTTLTIFLATFSIGYGQCSVDLKTTSNTSFCYADSAINLSNLLIVSNNDMILSSKESGLLTKSNNTWWLNTKLLKGKSYDSLSIKVYKEYQNTSDTCYNKDSISLTIYFPDLRIKQPKSSCYNDGNVNITLDWDPSSPDMVFSSNIPGLITTIGKVWWFNTGVLPAKTQTVLVYKSITTKMGCYAKDSFYVTINANPTVKVQDKSYCQDIGDIELSSGKEEIVILPNQSNIKGGLRTWSVLNKDGAPPPVVLRNDGTPMDAKWLFVSFYPDYSRLGKYELEFKFQNNVTGCLGYDTMILEILEVPVIKFTPIPQQCNYWDTLNLDNYVNLNKGTWEVIEQNGLKEQEVGQYSSYVIDKHKFDPKIVGKDAFSTFRFRYNHTVSGCAVKDSTGVDVYGRPALEKNILLDTQCSSFKDSIVLLATVNGIYEPVVWKGNHVEGINFFPRKVIDSAQDFNSYALNYSYQDPFTTCESYDSTSIVVQIQPTVSISLPIDSIGIIIGTTAILNAESTHSKGIVWSSTGDGSFLNNSSLNNEYNHGTNDKTANSIFLTIETVPFGVCPIAKDKIKLEIFPLSIKDQGSKSLTIYPSPTASNFTIELPENFNSGNVRILGINGSLVKEIYLVENKGHFTEDISLLPSGIYFVELVTNTEVYRGKISKK